MLMRYALGALLVRLALAADLYATLGLTPDASDKDIKSAYRRLSLKLHPDKNPNDETAAERFAAVARAYEVLSDPDSRILYDHGGEEALADGGGGGGGGPFGGGLDPFEMFFGGRGGGGGGGGRGGRGGGGKRGPDAHVELRVSLAELYSGGTRQASVTRRVVCRGCRDHRPATAGWEGAGCAGCVRCPPEVRMVHRQMAPGFVMQQQEQVQSRDFCKAEAAILDATIEKGMADGTQLTFERMAEQLPGQVPGDIRLTLRAMPHPAFRRDGTNLHTEMTISLRDALVGFSKAITHLDGRAVPVSRTGVTKPFETIAVAGEGMPHHGVPSQKGRLLVHITVDFPRAPLSAAQREVVEALF
ncbi:hypothetical protein KFE25_002258 [Diacronema lutheri]|uniref:J domain-containing protein n=3 Tax=Diacronema lutheri TaxID=2081491 RepID=A0A8J5X6G2_DIALT|nr:hypothetical protein KFE25_002258 [Diacronema lutheri]